MSDERPIDEHIPRDPDRSSDVEREPINIDAAIEPKQQYPFCGNCGQQRIGLGDADACPSCNARPKDPACSFCGYTLSGLSVNDVCPECGKPIWDSNRGLPTSGFAITSMVLGIVSIVSCTLYGFPSVILGPLALVFCHMGKKQLRNGERAGATMGFCTAGFWTGLVGCLFGLAFIGFFVYIILQM